MRVDAAGGTRERTRGAAAQRSARTRKGRHDARVWVRVARMSGPARWCRGSLEVL
ncbi:hypothetical protein B0H17DRAFT_1122712, partial [Mycena rosella]